MKIKDLFDEGLTFDEFIKTDTGSYREKTLEILDKITFEEEYINKIKSIKHKVNILVCAEMWCPDCMINLPVIQKMKQYNNNIEISIIEKEGNEEFFKEFCPSEKIKIPTFIIYDENFKELGTFIEHPKALKEIVAKGNEPNIIVCMRKYNKGEYAQETLKDILEVI
ncbi:hypothetical protein CLPU_10c00020 [Gottschalkia purinilytica]|uniref:Thioredoxin n=1 Tax=Gottschalkia purinilytica TaxID=1503 RepID=A0A0L0W8R2_GOTPU|nr:thioredoxin family protein [Gottschalkia purinilytica]KNF07948.1 hypothetical protein CLPU_10c00020 [Gottschalkia purinilytica]